MLAAVLHVPLPVDDPSKDLGAADVDADDAFFVQSARLPYWLGQYYDWPLSPIVSNVRAR